MEDQYGQPESDKETGTTSSLKSKPIRSNGMKKKIVFGSNAPLLSPRAVNHFQEGFSVLSHFSETILNKQ